MLATDTLRSPRHLVVALHLAALCLLALHLYVRTLAATTTALPLPESPEAAWWGLWPFTYLPHWAALLAAGLVLGALLAGWLLLRRPAGAAHPALAPLPVLGAAALLLQAAFWAFPVAHTRWGDAYLLTHAIAWPDPDLRLTHSWQAPLDLFLHSQLWLWLHAPLQWQDAQPVYRLLSPLAGALYLGVALALALGHNRRWAPAWLIFAALTSLGLIQLFYGYVENYSFAAAGILAYLWLGLEVLQGRRPLWLAATMLAVTNAIHPSTIVYGPSLLYLGWQRLQNDQQGGRAGGSVKALGLQIALPICGIAGATLLLMEAGGHGLAALLGPDRPGGADGRWFVPLLQTTTRWEHYTMFSWLHLRDFLNQQLLVAPLALPSLLVIASYRLWSRRPGARPERYSDHHSCQSVGAAAVLDCERPTAAYTPFLLTAASCHLLLTWVWNPDYGGQRDWDLFSLAAIPLALFWVDQMARSLPERRSLLAAALPLLVLQGVHTAAWIYQNTLPWSWPD